jgi:hypothetical protein
VAGLLNEMDFTPADTSSQIPDSPFLLFHWAPVERRAGITRSGLVPGKRSIDRLWRPPFVCFSTSPSLAWVLSAAIHPEIPLWDLWCTWSTRLTGYELLFDHDSDGDSFLKEVRVYERIYKRDIWFIGTRHQDGERGPDMSTSHAAVTPRRSR